MNAPSLSSRLAVCSWSLQPATPQELVAAVKATGLQMVLDIEQRAGVVLQFFDSEEDMRDSEAGFDAMDPSETPGTRASIDRGEVKLDLKM